VLLRLSVLLERDDYRRHAETVLEGLSGVITRIPGGFGRLLSALDFYLSTPYEVAIVGDPEAEDTQALMNVVYSAYLPNKVVAGRSESDEEAVRLVPLLADRPTRNGKATAYVCVNYACQNPSTEPEELREQLGGRDLH
jgi:uncharacterized protein YyaL (SSP411 family)